MTDRIFPGSSQSRAQMKLTTATVRNLDLPKGKSEVIYFDEDVPGFGLRLREGGSRSWIFQYKIGAKHRRIALGKLKALEAGKARDNAKDLYAKVRLGHDPAGERVAANAKAHQTFKAVADEFVAHKRQTLRPSAFAGVEHHVLIHATTLHELQIDRIKLADIATGINTVEKNSGGPTRNRVRTTLSTFFSWAISEGYTTGNPVMGTRRADEASRDRVLSPAELRIIWNALPDDHFGTIMKLLALPGNVPAKSRACAGQKSMATTSSCPANGQRTTGLIACHWHLCSAFAAAFTTNTITLGVVLGRVLHKAGSVSAAR
jgi:hypothetical protein